MRDVRYSYPHNTPFPIFLAGLGVKRYENSKESQSPNHRLVGKGIHEVTAVPDMRVTYGYVPRVHTTILTSPPRPPPSPPTDTQPGRIR